MKLPIKPDESANTLTRNRYQRISAWYDRMERMSEKRFAPWRAELWSKVRGPYVLEVGVGTGKNIPYYPSGVHATAVDLTPGMLEHARKRTADLGLNVDLHLGDVQALEFPEASFDSAVATFVFCSVPDPILGLSEIKRVVKPGGQVFLLEHMRSENPIVGALMDVINPFIVPLMGANINRRTVENVRKSGLVLEKVEDLGKGGIFKLLVARVI
jgi:ubiquinone/menaquinone biosynthesis C-methylase UbiE